MTLTFYTEVTCGLCGHHSRGLMIYSGVRINRRSLRTERGFGASAPPRCVECGHPRATCDKVVMLADAKSAAKVAAYRRRKGWDVAA